MTLTFLETHFNFLFYFQNKKTPKTFSFITFCCEIVTRSVTKDNGEFEKETDDPLSKQQPILGSNRFISPGWFSL